MNFVFDEFIFERNKYLQPKELTSGFAGGIGLNVLAVKKDQSVKLGFNDCTFISNEATRTKPKNEDPAFGGGAVYMSVKNSNVSNCTFKKNIGSGVKIYNDFE